MKILRLRNKVFSEKKEEDHTKLKTLDKIGIWGYKHDRNKEHKRRFLEGKENSSLPYKDAALMGALTGGVLSLSAGETPISAIMDKKYKKLAALSIGGAITHPMLSRGVGYINNRRLKKDPHANDKALDRLNVAEGKMTKSEFAKKWYGKGH